MSALRRDPDKMTFLEHLEELRVRLIHSVVALLVAFAVLAVPPPVSPWIFHFFTDPMRRSNPDIQFIYTAPTEAFMLYMKMDFFVAIFLASPYLLYQLWSFIAPGLHPHEKRYAIPFIVFGTFFFIAGGAFGHYVLFPMTFGFLGSFSGADMKFMPHIDDYFSFYSWFLLGLGLVFQLPVIIFVLARIGLVTAGFLLRQFKYAFLGSFVISAVITPTGDVVTQTMLAGPLIGLYLLGVLVAWLFGRARRAPASSTVTAA